jgi:hypothetical protein
MLIAYEIRVKPDAAPEFAAFDPPKPANVAVQADDTASRGTVTSLIADAVVFAGEVGTAGSDGTVCGGLALGVAHRAGVAHVLRARLVAAAER